MNDRHRLVLLVSGGLGAALGGSVLVGWYVSSPLMVQVLPSFSAMQPATAFSFVLLGAGLLALSLNLRPWTLACAVAVTIVAVLTLLEYLLGVDLGVDYLPARAGLLVVNPHPGRMGLLTAACFMQLGTALTLRIVIRRPIAGGFYSASLSLGVLIAATWVLLVYLTSLSVYHGLWRFTQMALHTALGLALLSGSMLVAILLELRAIADERMGVRRSRLTLQPGRSAWLVLGMSMAMTGVAWYVTALRITESARTEFADRALKLELVISNRMSNYEQVLFGARGLFVSSIDVTRQEWHAYVEAQMLQKRFPGVIAASFAPLVRAAELGEHVRAARAQGAPNYVVHPASERDEHYPILYMEPLSEKNRPLLGFELFSEPARRAAMERARDAGTVALTELLTLLNVDEGNEQPGVLMYLPVYHGSLVPDSVEERRAMILGFVSCTFRVDELMKAILASEGEDVSLQVFDGGDPQTASSIYDLDASLPQTDRILSPMFELRRGIEVGGRTWTLDFSSRPSFHAKLPYYQPIALLLCGSMVSVLLFGIAWSLSSTRARAVSIVKATTRKLRDSERRYRELVDHGHGLMWTHDMEGVLIYINPAAAALLGYPREELIGRNIQEYLAPDHRSQLGVYLQQIQTLRRHSGTMTVVTRAGDRRTCRYDNSYHESEETGAYVLAHAQDVTELRQAQQALEKANAAMREMATRDPLTGLANRRLLYEHLAQGIEQCRRTKRMLAVLFLDLDRFKQVNDALGHGAGDELLQSVAEALRSCCRKSDLPARLGGDEFVVMLTNIDDIRGARRVAEKFSAELRRVTAARAGSGPVTASIGVSLFPGDGDDPETLVQRADEAMYRAKAEGRDACRFHAEQPLATRH